MVDEIYGYVVFGMSAAAIEFIIRRLLSTC